MCVTSYSLFFMQVSSWGGYVFLINLIPLHVLTLMATGRFSHRIYVAYSTLYCVGTILSMQISFVGFQPVQSSEHMLVSNAKGLQTAISSVVITNLQIVLNCHQSACKPQNQFIWLLISDTNVHLKLPPTRHRVWAKVAILEATLKVRVRKHSVMLITCKLTYGLSLNQAGFMWILGYQILEFWSLTLVVLQNDSSEKLCLEVKECLK